MRQQRGANAAGAAAEDDAGITGPEASVLEPSPISRRTPSGSDAVRPGGPEASRTELLGVPQTHPGGIAGKTVRAKGCGVRWCPFFVIHLRRNFEGLQALLGETIKGIVCSDRWAAYSKLPLERRQICWAHRKRDFRKLFDRGGPAEAIGRVGLEVVECLFADWWEFRRGELDRPGLQARLDPTARELQGVLDQGCSCADSKAATLCADVLALYPAF